ncbi:ribosomal protein S7 domain-containing protein [Hygrophoropsis aurantiaca]|uniref:Ribosomal protein S7 domain-containing protein n=1 Tax=Hygrophoropsis aurantiaca TaxID=72124 RepID=A0ACB8AM39_9AGAM|nr:ribosomal protein S7 domain-containing protein [Hygrophoropsis aurantiaca]
MGPLLRLPALRLTTSRLTLRSTRIACLTSQADANTATDSAEIIDSLLGASSNGSSIDLFDHVAKSLTPAPKPSVKRDSSQEDMLIPPASDPLLDYLTSALQHHGHRAKASRTVSRTLLHIHALTRAPPLPIVREAILAAAPAVRCMSQKSGSKNIPKPIALSEKQRIRFSVKAILSASEGKSGKAVEERLARELIAVVQGRSSALEAKEKIHRFAMVNRGNLSNR